MAPGFMRILFVVLATAGLVACADAGYERLSDALCDDLPQALSKAGTPTKALPQMSPVEEEAGTSVPADQPLDMLDMAPAVFVIDEFVTSAEQTTSF